MNTVIPSASSSQPHYLTDEVRWQAMLQRDPAADGAFLCAVRTTGIYCRPVCPARLPLRQNVGFYSTCQEAELAGFRPCKRCRPKEPSLAERQAAVVAQACRIIEEADEAPGLEELAAAVGVSRHHFHRLFKSQTGVTPKAYAMAHRTRRLKGELANDKTVTQAIYRAGFSSSSRFYESSTAVLGMTPQAFRAGGEGTVIRFAIGECWLGAILVAASDKGVCCILLGDDPQVLAVDLQDRFPQAQLIGGDAQFEQLIAMVVGFVATPTQGLDLPLDIRGTAFQQRVWEALREIPAGTTATYTEIAARIGQPKSVRAVAQACGANPLAVAIPCHRVVRTDGSLAGYRWGVERKSELLQREREVTAPSP